jgi:VWFA-related protein
MRKASALLLSLLLLSPSLNTLAQQQNSPAPGDAPQQGTSNPYDDEVVRITTNLVQLDAVVVDKNGRYVTDLRPEDFEVVEDGKRQEITSFSYVDVEPGAKAQPAQAATIERTEKKKSAMNAVVPPVRLRPEQLRRTVALVVDDLSLSAESMAHVKEALKNYLDKQAQDNDLSAILRTSSGVGVLQQFTSDKRILYAALDRVNWYPLSRGGLNAVEPKDILSEPAAERSGNSVDDSKMGTSAENREENSIADTIDALTFIVRGFQKLPGRKAVVVFTDSLRLFSRIDNALSSNVGRMRKLIDLANRSSVVFYSIDARGLQPLTFTAGEKVRSLTPQNAREMVGIGSPRQNFFEDQDGMSYLARETGGTFMKDNNDFNKGVQRVLEDQKGYYLLGYRPDASTFDPKTGQLRFHNLKVKLNRPGLTVRSRTGFYGIAEPKFTGESRTPRQQLMEALASPFTSSGIDIRMTSLFNNEAASGSFMRSLVYVNAKDLQFTDEANGSRRAVLDIAAVIFDNAGRAVNQVMETREVRVTAEGYRTVLQDGLTYSLNVPVKQAGGYQMRVAVRDATSQKTGSANQFISVPDINKGRLALSGIVIAGNASQSQEGQGAAATSFDPRFGPAVRRLKQGMLLDYGYVIYNAQPDRSGRRPQLTTQLKIYRDGKPIFTSNVAPLDLGIQTDLRRLVAGGSLQTGDGMATGDYALQIIVTDISAQGKQRTATQWADFEIVK